MNRIWVTGNAVSGKTTLSYQLAKILNEAADIIIFLDYPRYVCYLRVFRANRKYIFRSRLELPQRCPEVLVVGKLIKIIWNFHNLVKLTIINHIEKNINFKKIFHIRSNRELAFAIHKIKKLGTHSDSENSNNCANIINLGDILRGC